MRFFKKALKRAPRKVARARGGKRSSVSVAVKKYVKRSLHANIENKSIQVSQTQSFGTYLESPDLNAFPMLPQTGYWTLPQGVGSGARLGCQIKIRKIYLNYALYPNPYDATFNPNPVPVEVQLMLGFVRQTPSSVPVQADVQQLFQNGSSASAPESTLKDLLMNVNTDYWTIKKRWRHKIGFAESAGTGGIAGNQFNANNDFKLNAVRRMDITKMCPSHCVFNDNTGGTTTRNLYLMYEAVSALGSAVASPFTPCTLRYWIDFVYEDA